MFNRLLVFSILLFLACSSACAQSYKDVTVKKFEKKIGKRSSQLIDVRTPEEYVLGHIEGAALVNWKDSTEFVKHATVLDKSKPVYVYCRSGNRSSKASDWFIQHGFKKVFNLQNGILAWQEAGKKTVK